MKRRDFIRYMAAMTVTPALPVKVIAGSSTVSAAVYAKAVHYAKLWGTSVPEMYTSALGLSHNEAQFVFDRLVSERIIVTPDAFGISNAAFPYFKNLAITKKPSIFIGKNGNNLESNHNICENNSFKTIKENIIDHTEQDQTSIAIDEEETP